MKDILTKFSPKISSEIVGEDIEENTKKTFSVKIEKVFDLHGYFESELKSKMEFILAFCSAHRLSHIKIVTGKGKKIVFSEVLRILRHYKRNLKINHYKYDEGSFRVLL